MEPPEGWKGEFVWGTSVGYPIRLDPMGRSELRIGIHLTLMRNTWVGYSGVQLLYQYRPKGGLALQLGIMQTSVPFGAMLVLGVVR